MIKCFHIWEYSSMSGVSSLFSALPRSLLTFHTFPSSSSSSCAPVRWNNERKIMFESPNDISLRSTLPTNCSEFQKFFLIHLVISSSSLLSCRRMQLGRRSRVCHNDVDATKMCQLIECRKLCWVVLSWMLYEPDENSNEIITKFGLHVSISIRNVEQTIKLFTIIKWMLFVC